MAKRKRITTREKIEKRIREGYGQGEGANYKSWIEIQDAPSEGVSSRGKGWKTGRVHHLLSRNELKYLYLLEWSDYVIDIREQYPLLPFEKTVEIAESLGIKHPTDPQSKELDVMTTDFMITLDFGKGPISWARTVKPVKDLNYRQIEKFQIEKVFYEELGINWAIIIDTDLPEIIFENIDFLHDAYYVHENDYIDEDMISYVAPKIFKALSSSSSSMAKTALKQDRALGLEPGTCLFITRHMLARKKWLTDIHTEIRPSRRLKLQLPEEANVQGGYSA